MSARRWPRFSREWLLAAGALGLVAGLSFAGDRYVCAHMSALEGEASVRDAALEAFTQTRCDALACEQVELVAQGDCVAKIELRAPRTDRYGETVGTFVTSEGLRYSPALRRWRTRHVLADRQVLGLPRPTHELD